MYEEIFLMQYESTNNFRIPLKILVSCWVNYETPRFLITKKNEFKKYSLILERLNYSMCLYLHPQYLYKNKCINKSQPTTEKVLKKDANGNRGKQ